MSKTFWAIIAVIIIIFGGIIAFNKSGEETTDPNIQPTNHVVGAGTTGVTLIEYGDFECSACGSYYPLIEQVKAKYGDQITFQFRHLPLLQLHPNAMVAARSAEAAHNQGKFWEMYNLMFQNQLAWGNQGIDAKPIFEQYAAQLNLDVARFRADVASSATNATVNADVREFEKLGVSKSTPTFVLDGQVVKASSLEEFSKLIDDAIAAKSSSAQE